MARALPVGPRHPPSYHPSPKTQRLHEPPSTALSGSRASRHTLLAASASTRTPITSESCAPTLIFQAPCLRGHSPRPPTAGAGTPDAVLGVCEDFRWLPLSPSLPRRRMNLGARVLGSRSGRVSSEPSYSRTPLCNFFSLASRITTITLHQLAWRAQEVWLASRAGPPPPFSLADGAHFTRAYRFVAQSRLRFCERIQDVTFCVVIPLYFWSPAQEPRSRPCTPPCISPACAVAPPASAPGARRSAASPIGDPAAAWLPSQALRMTTA